MVFPAEVALRFVDEPIQIAVGVAETAVGTPGNAFTVTVTDARVSLTQLDPFNASA